MFKKRLKTFALGAMLVGVLGSQMTACESRQRPLRVALLAGASGENEAENFFVDELRGYRKALIARGWDVQAVVGMRDGLLPGSRRATNSNLLGALNAVLARAGKGDQVMLLIHTHGREQEKYWGQRSHSLASEDKDKSGAEPGFDLDSIEPALLSAKERGAKVALIDLSCYSGSTQAIRGASCTVTLSASNYVSLCSGREEEKLFGSKFFRLPAPGTPIDLETQFLKARREDRDSVNLPQISSRRTPALKDWESFLSTVDPLDIFEDLKELRKGPAPYDPRRLLDAVGGRRIGEPLARALKIRARLEAAIPALAREYDEDTLQVPVPGRDPLPLAPAYLAEMLDPQPAPDGYTHVQTRLLAALAPVRPELERKFREPLAEFRGKRKAFDQLTEDLAQAAGEIFNAERVFYDEVSRDEPGQNGCGDFGL